MNAEDVKRANAASADTDVSARHSSGTVAPAAAWAFAFLILRVFAVSGYHWDTAFEVSTTISVSDGLSLAFGSLMAEHQLVALLLMVVLLVAALGQAPWVPREQIKTNDGTITAYVLGVDSGYLSILTPDHDFIILNSNEVISRK